MRFQADIWLTINYSREDLMNPKAWVTYGNEYKYRAQSEKTHPEYGHLTRKQNVLNYI